MPTVPSRDAPSTNPQVGFTQRLDNTALTPAQAAAPFEQQVKLGQAVQGAANKALDIQIDAQREANQLRVADATNQLRQRALDAAYDPDKGFLRLKGLDALSRPDGASLEAEYGGQLDTGIGEIAATLGNDAQRKDFELQAMQIAGSFRADLKQHTLKEYTAYHTSVADGTIKLAQQEATLYWNEPEKVQNAIDGMVNPETGERVGGIKQAIYNKAKLSGMSATEAEAVMNEAASNVHTGVIMAALSNDNPTYAQSYFAKYKEGMSGADILKVQGQITDQVNTYSAAAAVKAASTDYATDFNPSSFDRLKDCLKHQESGNREYNPDGTRVTSPVGARGVMQLMPATAAKPGYGLKPSDGTPADDERLATQYLQVMLKKYDTVEQALAAYNAGPGVVDKAIKKAKGGDWLAHCPEETRNYVPSIINRFTSGGTTRQPPTKLDFVNSALAKLGDNPNPKLAALTQETASKQYALMEDARKQQSEQVLMSAQNELLNNGGSMANLTPATRAALAEVDPANYKKALDFAKAVADPVTTNPEAYATAALHPGEIAAMPEPVFMHFLKTNFSAADQARIIDIRKETQSGQSDNSIASLNTSALNTALEGRLESIGINGNPTKTDTASMARVGGIQRFVREDLYAQQKALGRKLSPEEIEKRLDVLFTKNVTFKNTLFGVNYSDTDKPLLSLTVRDIPDADYLRIKNGLKGRGVTEPGDDLILRMYRTMELNRKPPDVAAN